MTAEEAYVKACRKVNRELEMERNGGRWIAVDRPHKNKKAYERKPKHKNKGNFDVPLYCFSQKISVLILSLWR